MTDAPTVTRIFDSWGQRLRRAREAQGKSQPAIAQQIGLSQSAVSLVEAGRRQSLPTVMAVARALDLTLTDVADGAVDDVRIVVASALSITPAELDEIVDGLAPDQSTVAV